MLCSCREDEYILPMQDNVIGQQAADSRWAGMYILNEGNMGSNKCTIDYLDLSASDGQTHYMRNIFSSRNPSAVKELGDVFGPVEKPLNNLINISLLKNMARGYGVTKVTVNKMGAGVVFEDSSVFKNEGIMKAVSIYSGEAVLTSTIPPNLIFDAKNKTPEEKIEKLISFFITAGNQES